MAFAPIQQLLASFRRLVATLGQQRLTPVASALQRRLTPQRRSCADGSREAVLPAAASQQFPRAVHRNFHRAIVPAERNVLPSRRQAWDFWRRGHHPTALETSDAPDGAERPAQPSKPGASDRPSQLPTKPGTGIAERPGTKSAQRPSSSDVGNFWELLTSAGMISRAPAKDRQTWRDHNREDWQQHREDLWEYRGDRAEEIWDNARDFHDDVFDDRWWGTWGWGVGWVGPLPGQSMVVVDARCLHCRGSFR